jgi:Na+/melibiose symporter-like transporter
MEPEATRGSLQAKLAMINTLAKLIAKGIAAFGFNGKMYLGSWDQRKQLGFHQYCSILTCSSGLALVLCFFCLQEPSQKKASSSQAISSLREQAHAALKLLESKAFFFICLYVFGTSSIFAISTPASTWVGLQWAGSKMLQRQLASLLAQAASIVGFWFATRYLLNVSWRKIIAVTVISTSVIDAVPQVCTIFDIFRNQYFALGEPIASEIPRAAATLVNMILANEIADEGNCGLVAGILATVQSLGDPLSVVLSNQVFGLFKPGLSNRDNYIADTSSFRQTVGMSYALSYLFSFLSLSLLPLLPRQKAEAQQRKQEWPSKSRYAVVLLIIFCVAFVYALLVDFISLVPDWACLQFVGGEGCRNE